MILCLTNQVDSHRSHAGCYLFKLGQDQGSVLQVRPIPSNQAYCMSQLFTHVPWHVALCPVCHIRSFGTFHQTFCIVTKAEKNLIMGDNYRKEKSVRTDAQYKEGEGTRLECQSELPRQHPLMLEGVQKCSGQRHEWKHTCSHCKPSFCCDGIDGQLSQGWQEAAQ